MAATTLDPLIDDLLRWVDREPRALSEVLEAWRTSCPRLTVWEDACDRGLLERRHEDGVVRIAVTPAGRRFLAARH